MGGLFSRLRALLWQRKLEIVLVGLAGAGQSRGEGQSSSGLCQKGTPRLTNR